MSIILVAFKFENSLAVALSVLSISDQTRYLHGNPNPLSIVYNFTIPPML